LAIMLVAAFAAGSAILATAAEAGQTVKIGGIDLPADCALAKNERPRLLFRGRDLPKYKERIAGPMKADFERFKAYWDAKIAEKGYDSRVTNPFSVVGTGHRIGVGWQKRRGGNRGAAAS
jgi:hypothetical protein